jgi:hypothetical protein
MRISVLVERLLDVVDADGDLDVYVDGYFADSVRVATHNDSKWVEIASIDGG